MRELRQRSGFTAEELAEAMRAHGVPWQRSVVAYLETGRRKTISVDELLALALVLKIRPAALLVDIKAEAAQVAPDLEVLPAELLVWLLDDDDLPEPAPVTYSEPDMGAVRSLWRAWIRVRIGEDRPSLGEPLPDDMTERRLLLSDKVAEVRRRGIQVPAVISGYLARTEAER